MRGSANILQDDTTGPWATVSSVQPFILVLGYEADIGTTGGSYAGDSETVCLNQNISGTIF